MMIIWEQRDKLQALIILALAVAALRRGGGPERWSVAVLVAMTVAIWNYQTLTPQEATRSIVGYGDVTAYLLLFDLLALGVLFVVALKANRSYPILLAGCQLVSVTAHFASGLLKQAFPLAYALFNIVPFYCMIAVSTVGLLAHFRRARRWGPYPDWRKS